MEKRILLAFDLTRETGQDMQRAAVRAIRAQKLWRVDSCLPGAANIRRALKGNPPPAGVIAHVSSHAMARALEPLETPIINVSDILDRSPFQRVCADGYAAGRELANYLCDKGIGKVLYFAGSTHHYSKRRLAGLSSVLGHRNPCTLSVATAGQADRTWFGEHLQNHLETDLPFAAILDGGQMARQFYGAANHLGLSVPHDVAVVDFNAEPTYCESVHPMLSCVGMPSTAIGRRAACELVRRIDGESEPEHEIRLPPPGIQERASSSVVATRDPRLRAALAAIAETQGDITVNELLRIANASRRPLEHLFRSQVGRSPHDMIRHARLRRAKSLLANTDMNITTIAAECRFSTSSHLGSVFRRHFGCTPSAWRERSRR